MRKLFNCHGALGGASVALLALLLSGCGLPNGTLSISERHEDGLTVEPPRLGPECTDTLSCCPTEYLTCSGNPDEQIRCQCLLWACDETTLGAERCWRTMPQPTGVTTAECAWTEFSYACEGPLEADGSPDGGGTWACETDPEAQTWRCEASFPPNPLDAPEGASDYVCEPDTEFNRLVCTGPEPPPAPVSSGPQTTCPYGLDECPQAEDALSSVGQTGTSTTHSGGIGGGSAATLGGRPSSSSSSTDGATSPSAGFTSGTR